MCTSLLLYPTQDIIPDHFTIYKKLLQFLEGKARSKIILIQYVYISLAYTYLYIQVDARMHLD